MDIIKIEELIKILENSRTAELAVRKGDCLVCLKKGHKPKTSAASKRQAISEEPSADTADEFPLEQYILAPMVGIFHNVDSAAAIGSEVELGQVVGAIESMKLLNDVVAGVSGTIREVLVEDGTPVEYGQPLCRVEPA